MITFNYPAADYDAPIKLREFSFKQLQSAKNLFANAVSSSDNQPVVNSSTLKPSNVEVIEQLITIEEKKLSIMEAKFKNRVVD